MSGRLGGGFRRQARGATGGRAAGGVNAVEEADGVLTWGRCTRGFGTVGGKRVGVGSWAHWWAGSGWRWVLAVDVGVGGSRGRDAELGRGRQAAGCGLTGGRRVRGRRKAAGSTDQCVSRQDTIRTWEIPGPGALHRRSPS